MKAVGGMLQRQLAVWFVLGMAGSAHGFPWGSVSGFEVGNGSGTENYRARLLESLEEVDRDYDGKVTELYAPASDCNSPRTRLRVDVFSIAASAEDAVRSILTSTGWVEFTAERAVGIHRETLLRKDGLSRLDMQVFREDKKFVIRLEGNKHKSKAYSALSTSLLEEVD